MFLPGGNFSFLLPMIGRERVGGRGVKEEVWMDRREG